MYYTHSCVRSQDRHSLLRFARSHAFPATAGQGSAVSSLSRDSARTRWGIILRRHKLPANNGSRIGPCVQLELNQAHRWFVAK